MKSDSFQDFLASKQTLNDRFLSLKNESQQGVHFIEGNSSEDFLSYQHLYDEALNAMGYLKACGVKEGDELVICTDSNKTFLTVFWACLFGGVIAVPVSVGTRTEQQSKIAQIWNTLNNPYLFINKRNLERLSGALPDIDSKHKIIDTDGNKSKYSTPSVFTPEHDAIAYIQFSSGSTSDPKGVVLTHRNLMNNTVDIAVRSEIDQTDKSLSWMPLTHDMGLICFHLTSLVAKIDQFLIPTPLFIRNPKLWLTKASEHKISILYSPNFGYKYLLDSLGEFGTDIDLSSIRLIYNGAEPIDPLVARRFQQELNRYGLRQNVIFPGYGLAEASVAVSLPNPGEAVKTYYLKRSRLNIGNEVVALQPDDKNAVSFVETGYPIDHCQVRIADGQDAGLRERSIGHIQIRGENVTKKYYNHQDATNDALTKDGWLRTGDLGFLNNDRLVITGRVKNLIIINGQNYYPQDIEKAAITVDGVDLGKVVACGYTAPADHTQRLVIFLLHKGKNLEKFFSLGQKVKHAIAQQTGLMAEHVIPVRQIPKTTSGKIQNFKLIGQFLKGAFDEVLDKLKELQTDKAEGGNTVEKIQRIWAKVSKSDIKGIFESAWSNDINSLLGMQFVALVNQRFSVSLTLKDVFTAPSLAAFGDLVEGAPSAATVDFTQHEAEANLAMPLLDIQKRFWVLDKYGHADAGLHLPFVYQLNGAVNVAAFVKAWKFLIDRHGALRTIFYEEGGKLRQKVLPHQCVHFELSKKVPKDTSDSEIARLVTDMVTAPFDLEKAPLLRVSLITLTPHRHVLVVVFHHIISDGWSLISLHEEFARAYDAYVCGVAPQFPLSISYEQAIRWKLARLKAEGQRALKYWKEEFRDGAVRLHLPSTQTEVNGKDSALESSFVIADKDLDRLAQVSETLNCTYFTALFAALSVVLYKYTGQQEIVVGTDIAGRDDPRLNQTVGCFINTVAVKTVCPPNYSLADFFDIVKQKILGAIDQQYYAFDDLVKEVGLSHSEALFNVLFLYQNFGGDLPFSNIHPNVEQTQLSVAANGVLADLQIEFIEVENKPCRLNIRYSSDVFSKHQIDNLPKHLFKVIRTAAENSQQTIGQMSILTDVEVDEITSFTGLNKEIQLPSKSFLSYFEDAVSRYPDNIALRCGENEVAYREVYSIVGKTAAFIATAFGITPGTRVALLVDRDVEMVMATLSILQAGGAYVPIDADWPDERINHVMTDADVEYLIYSAGLKERACKLLKSLDIAGWEYDRHIQATAKIDNPVSLDQPAYILYTSGSTGKPKGVIIGHQALIDYTVTFQQYFDLSSTDRIIQQSSLGFDTSVEEIFPALAVGATLLILPEGGRNIDNLLYNVEHYQASVLSTTPLVIQEINQDKEKLESLRLLISGGDVLLPHQISNLIDQVPIYNTYGPTEATVCVTYNQVQQNEPANIIGTPLSNHQVYILNEHLQHQPVGVPGEIFLSGLGISEGYVDEQLNDKHFLENPFSDVSKLYRTGDFGAWLPDGRIIFSGRKDHQVKVMGYRVELGEVEKALRAHPDVKEAVVVSKNNDGLVRLAAYCTFYKDTDEDSIREYLLGKVPFYMVPQFILTLKTLPVNANGKVDKAALPEASELIKEKTTAPNVLKTPEEQVLLDFWQEIFKCSDISCSDNFFDLGGHSITAVRIIAKVNRYFSVNLAIKDLYTAPTITALARTLTRQSKTEGIVKPIEDQEMYPASYSQRRLWVLDQLESSKEAYILSWAFETEGDLNTEVFQDVFGALKQQYQILRTVLVERRGELYQVVKAAEKYPENYEFLDVRSSEDKGELIKAAAHKNASTAFDLQNGPLWKIRLLQYDDEKFLFLFSIHHSIADGSSINRVAEEIKEQYNRRLSGHATSAPLSAALQYKDYVHWQQARITDQYGEELKKYWLKELRAPLPIVDFPTDYHRPRKQTYHGNTFSVDLDPQTYETLNHFVAKEQVTHFMVLLAAVKTLMYRYTYEEDLVVGIPVEGRNHEFHQQIGMYLNTIALRTHVSGEESFEIFVKRIGQKLTGAIEHQEYPFDLLVQHLDLERDLSRSPVFDIMVGFQDIRDAEHSLQHLSGLTFTPYPLEKKISQFDLSFDFYRSENGIQLHIEYNTDLFVPERISAMADHFSNILQDGIVNSQKSLRHLKLIGEKEFEKLKALGTPDHVAAPTGLTVLHTFEQYVKGLPKKTALIYEERRLTYEALNAEANKLANHLRDEYGVGRGMSVGIITQRSLEMVIAVLGVIKAGACYVPIDPEYPKSRIRYILKDSGVKIVVGDEPSVVDDAEGLTTVSLNHNVVLDQVSTADPVINYSLSDLVYINYTSGSTGKPKGVRVSHANVASVQRAIAEQYQLAELDVRLLQIASVSFDVFFGDLCRSIFSGGTLVICPATDRLSPARMADILVAQRINIFESTPAIVLPLMSYIHQHQIDISWMKIVLIGSDALLAEDYQRLLSQFGDSIRFFNTYGTTETTIDSTYYSVETKEEMIHNSLVPIGRPLQNTKLQILDQNQTQVPVGVNGELYIGGQGVTLGYLNREELNKQRFIQLGGEQWYRTGDQVRWLWDGNLAFYGRMDSQVKIRGYRVELEEIQNVILEASAVREAVVTLFHHEKHYYLVAYIVGHEPVDEMPLRKAVAASLPAYMVPNFFVEIEAVPLTPNGKIDRKALPAPTMELSVDGQHIPPRNHTEERLQAIWERLLGIKGIGVHDHFFEIGGHSLTAIQLMLAVQEELRADMKLSDVFEYPTIEKQAGLIGTLPAKEIEKIPPAEKNAYYPLTPSQRSLWIIDQLHGEQTTYNMPGAYFIEGALDIEALKKAFSILIGRYEILRTAFIKVKSEPQQQVLSADQVNFDLPLVHLDDNKNEREQIERWSHSVLYHQFDLSKPALFKGLIIQKNPGVYIFLFSMHHIISDGWSLRNIVREIIDLYESASHDASPVSLQYKDYVTWYQGIFQTETMRQQEAYWQEVFSAPVEPLTLPLEHPRPAVKTGVGRIHSFFLGKKLVKGISQLARDCQASNFMVITALLKVLLYKYTRQTDMVLGTPTAGRIHKDLDKQLGLFVNTLALRTTFEGEDSFIRLLSRVKAVALGAFENQLYPFDKLLETIDVPRDLSRSPLFDVMIAYENESFDLASLGNLGDADIYEYPLDYTISKYDLLFNFQGTEDRDVKVVIEYNKDLFSESYVQRLSAHLEVLANNVVHDPHQPLNALEYIPPLERDKIARFSGGYDSALPALTSVTQLLVEQVKSSPDAIAVADANGSLSFAGLQEQSNRVAHWLRHAFRVSEGSVVAVMLPKSVDFVVALWGVIKTGAAYMPVSLDIPEQRKKFLIEDSQAVCVIADAPGGDWVNVPVLYIHDERIQHSCKENLPINVDTESPIYLLYTSGTTGKPKGALTAHRGVSNLVQWLNRLIFSHYNTKITALLTASTAFDASVQQLFAPLLAGHRLLLLDDETKASPANFVKLLEEQQVKVFDITPSLLAVVIEQLKLENKQLRVDWVLVGGEPLSDKLIKSYHEVFPDSKLLNVYGLTEATVDSTFEIANARKRSPSSIGRPIDNTFITILDEEQRLVPIGVEGEIHIGGAGLSLGYYNNVKLTSERFIEDPSIFPGKIFKTGDKGKWLEDGTICFLGRKDRQVKINGYRIEPEEIEKSLLLHEHVRKVHISTVESGNATTLVAYYVASAAIEKEELTKQLRQVLPSYMIPHFFIFMEAFPLTSHGKIDERLLPAPKSNGYTGGGYPTTDLESQLVKIWSAVLDVKRIGVNDNFFDLGGHSLNAMRMIAHILDALKVELDLKAIFSNPTIELLAQYIENKNGLGKVVLDPIHPIEEQEYYSLSPSERRLWFFHQVRENTLAYHIYGQYDVSGPLDIALLQKAWEQVIDRHENLRTSFFSIEGTPYFSVLPRGAVSLKIDHKNMLNQGDKEAERYIDAFRNTRFDLKNPPLVKISAVQYQPGHTRLLTCVHHIISDGWSSEIIMKELVKEYNALHQGSDESCTEIDRNNVQYKDYCAWLQANSKLKKAERYWLKKFADIPKPLELPTDYPRPNARVFTGESLHFSVDEPLADRLQWLSQEHNASVFVLFLAGLKALMHRYTFQKDIVIGIPTNGRPHADLFDQIGFYVNTLPVRTQLDSQYSFTQLIEIVKKQFFEANQHQLYPFDQLVQELALKREMGRSPIFDVFMTYEKREGETLKVAFDECDIEPINLLDDTSKFDLSFHVIHRQGTFHLEVNFDNSLYKTGTIHAIGEQYLHLLREMAQSQHMEIGSISLASTFSYEKVAESDSFNFQF